MSELAEMLTRQVHDSSVIQGNQTRGKAFGEGGIEPWAGERDIVNFIVPARKDGRLQRGYSERKKTLNERIQQIYRKYNIQEKADRRNTNKQANSRQMYREMLKGLQKPAQFKQLGLKRQAWDINESLSLQTLTFKNDATLCVYEYQQARTSPKIRDHQQKCVNKFQRMMRIRDKVRKKNTIAVTRLKQKYLNQYNLMGVQQKPFQNDPNHAIKQKAKMKIRVRSQTKSKNTLQQTSPCKPDIKVVGVFSNALQYAQNRGLSNYTSASIRRTPCIPQLLHTFFASSN